MAFYQRVWAQIDKDGIVQNRIVADNYEDANYVTRCTYGENSLAVEINHWNVTDGDIYKDGTFYAPDGETEREHIPEVETEIAKMKSDIGGNVEDLTDAQMAITEIYEMLVGGA